MTYVLFVCTYVHTYVGGNEGDFLLIIWCISFRKKGASHLATSSDQVQMSDTREPINDKEVRSFGKERLDDVT